MFKYLLLLHAVHDSVHDSVHDLDYYSLKNIFMIKNFSEPKIYTGGIEINDLRTLSKEKIENALSKDWYIYYSIRNKETGKLQRMPNIKNGINTIKNIKERIAKITLDRNALHKLLQLGFNPAEMDLEDIQNFKLNNFETKDTKAIKEIVAINKSIKKPKKIEIVKEETIKEAFDFALKIKKNTLNETSYKNFELRIRKFRKSLNEELSVHIINKKSINNYLNDVLNTTSARTRNNTRTDISSLFQVLEDNDIIEDNFIRKISVLKSTPERNKTYKPEQQIAIFNYLEENDKILFLFIQFVCYNFLRPVEVCRLKIKDIDLSDKKIQLKTKNKAVKIKIIPDILINELPDLTQLNPDNYLFTPNGYGLEWQATENNRRDHFSKRFKSVIKDHFKLGIDYGLYSFRHTFITKLYRKIREQQSPHVAKSQLMLITGHTTMTALEKYLRDIDAELPEDYSALLK